MKLKLLSLSIFTFSVTSSYAQKIAFFNANEIVKSNPGAKKIDSSINTFLESLKSEYSYLQDEYKEKIDKLKDTTSMNDVKKNLLKQDIQSLSQNLSNYEASATQRVSQKRNELMAPFSKKVNEVVETLAKEGKFDVIFDISSVPVFYFNKENDLTEKIKNKIK